MSEKITVFRHPPYPLDQCDLSLSKTNQDLHTNISGRRYDNMSRHALGISQGFRGLLKLVNRNAFQKMDSQYLYKTAMHTVFHY